jgi:hypothetical protein
VRVPLDRLDLAGRGGCLGLRKERELFAVMAVAPAAPSPEAGEVGGAWLLLAAASFEPGDGIAEGVV